MNTGISMDDAIHGFKYLPDYRRPFNSFKPDEKWPYTALP